MKAEERAIQPENLPPPSAELAIIRTGFQAMASVMGRRKAARFLHEWVRIAASEESIRLLFPIRPMEELGAQAAVQRQALAWLRQVLPTLASRPPK